MMAGLNLFMTSKDSSSGRRSFPVKFILGAGYSREIIVRKTTDIKSQGGRTSLFVCVAQLVACRDLWVAVHWAIDVSLEPTDIYEGQL